VEERYKATFFTACNASVQRWSRMPILRRIYSDGPEARTSRSAQPAALRFELRSQSPPAIQCCNASSEFRAAGRQLGRNAMDRPALGSVSFMTASSIFPLGPVTARTENPPARCTQSPRSHHVVYTYHHVLPHEKHPFRAPGTRKNRHRNRSKPPNNLKSTTTHHKSPQKPKTRFIHSQLVRPRLLTLVSSEAAYSCSA
jgi:hypothetical protein